MTDNDVWTNVAELDELPERRVKTVTVGTKSLALVHYDGQYRAMDNRCPHQGGHLDEGSIEESGFGQYLAEKTTLVEYDMDITHVLLHNGELGKISKEQRAGEWDVWETSLHNPNFAEYAELCGARGVRVTDQSQLEKAMQEAIAHPGPALIEIMTDAELV